MKTSLLTTTFGLLSAALLLTGCTANRSMSQAQFREFPIGVYSADPKSDANMAAIKKAGFNTVHSYNTSDEDYAILLALAQKHDMKVMFNLDRKLVEQPGGLEKMRQTVRRFKDHPALSFWYLYDEPAGKITPEKLRPFYQMLKEETPNTPVALVTCWDETWDRYSDVLDIQMVDIYSVRDQKFPYAPLQEFTNFVKDAVKLGKPVMPVPQLISWKSFADQLRNQGYNEANFRYPNETELRYMAFGSMTQGVCGLFGYSYYHAIKTGGNPGWWNTECTKVFNEVRQFAAQVDRPDQPVKFKRPLDSNQFAAYWTGPNGNFLMLVNAWPLERPRVNAWLDGYFKQDCKLIPWGNTRQVKAELKNSRIKLEGPAQPWEVFIWKLEPVKGK